MKRGDEPKLPELTIPFDCRRRLAGVRLHRTRSLAAEDLEVRRGVQLTTPIRTVLDIAGGTGHYLLGKILDEGTIRRLWTPDAVADRLDRFGPSGRAGTVRLKALLDQRRGEGPQDSELEQRVLRVLKRLKPQVPEPVLHYQCVLSGRVIDMDLAWPEYRIDGEIDGYLAHIQFSDFERDRVRANVLGAHGWHIVHWTSAMDDDAIAARSYATSECWNTAAVHKAGCSDDGIHGADRLSRRSPGGAAATRHGHRFGAGRDNLDAHDGDSGGGAWWARPGAERGNWTQAARRPTEANPANGGRNMPTRRRPLFVSIGILAGVVPLTVLLGGCGSGSNRTIPPQPESHALLTAATGSQTNQETGITVTGRAHVRGTPDVLTVNLTISTKAAHAVDALADNNRRTAEVLAVVRGAGVVDKDVATSGLNVGPTWTQTGAISGYQVDDSITIRLHDLSKAGAVIDAAAAKGGDALRIGGIDLTIDDTSSLLAAARTQAIQNAHDKAAAMASAAGARLGGVRAIYEQQPPAYPSGAARYLQPAAAGVPPSVPVQPGSQALDVEITVIYDLGP